ncbi:unnamed protein product [Pedinophyceae sp. YPF-701]|nr:unnamed protein product [Pedinophyceae sp. YPF-701]
MTHAAAEYRIKPSITEKWKESRAREIMRDVMGEKLQGVTYDPDNTSTLAREIADEIKRRLAEEGWPRFKHVVQVVLGEQRGQGLKMGSRCFWDADTDSHAQETFTSESLFCVAGAWGIYYY